MPWIYKYVDKKDNLVKYVGLVYNDSIKQLYRRIYEHKYDFTSNDKWKQYANDEFDIYVLEPSIVKTKGDAEIIEAHLIDYYKSYNYLNRAKGDWGRCSFIDESKLVWKSILDLKQETKEKQLLDDLIDDLKTRIKQLESDNKRLLQEINRLTSRIEVLQPTTRKDIISKRIKNGLSLAKSKGETIGLIKGTKLVTKKSIQMKELIKKYHIDFGGIYSKDVDVIKLLGISRNSYFKYKREIKNSLQTIM